MSPRNVFILCALIFSLGAVGLAAAVYQFAAPGGKTATQTSTVGGAFTMVDQDGKPVTEAALKGKPTLIFFGFTNCPDVCPTALYEITQAMEALAKQAQELQLGYE